QHQVVVQIAARTVGTKAIEGLELEPETGEQASELGIIDEVTVAHRVTTLAEAQQRVARFELCCRQTGERVELAFGKATLRRPRVAVEAPKREREHAARRDARTGGVQ